MRELDSIERVGVVGAGTMGNGIAQVAATAGHDVLMRDIDEEFIERGFDAIDSSLDRLVDSGTLADDEATAARERITGTTDLDALEDRDLVIEAAVEETEIKQEVFADLDETLPDEVVLATNTSTLSVTSIASATQRPELVVGVHFMNPVPVMDGVEIVVGERTGEETVALAHEFAEELTLAATAAEQGGDA